MCQVPSPVALSTQRTRRSPPYSFSWVSCSSWRACTLLSRWRGCLVCLLRQVLLSFRKAGFNALKPGCAAVWKSTGHPAPGSSKISDGLCHWHSRCCRRAAAASHPSGAGQSSCNGRCLKSARPGRAWWSSETAGLPIDEQSKRLHSKMHSCNPLKTRQKGLGL